MISSLVISLFAGPLACAQQDIESENSQVPESKSPRFRSSASSEENDERYFRRVSSATHVIEEAGLRSGDLVRISVVKRGRSEFPVEPYTVSVSVRPKGKRRWTLNGKAVRSSVIREKDRHALARMKDQEIQVQRTISDLESQISSELRSRGALTSSLLTSGAAVLEDNGRPCLDLDLKVIDSSGVRLKGANSALGRATNEYVDFVAPYTGKFKAVIEKYGDSGKCLVNMALFLGA